jgi:hypothetical protein
MRLLVIGFLLFAAATVGAQTKAAKGKIEDIKGMHRVFVSGPDRDTVVKILNGKAGLEVVNDANNAEFYLTFKVLRRDENIYATLIIGELTAHIRDGESVKEVWSREGSGGATGGAAVSGLAKKFLKDLEKLSKVE